MARSMDINYELLSDLIDGLDKNGIIRINSFDPEDINFYQKILEKNKIFTAVLMLLNNYKYFIKI